ncbi:superinfection immunity protein [Beijerinckia mobilis]|uniref:superinfection immunity protein n=1 Tax=Beijerinckia mobilis TaxID=231434 RepID=UPI0009FFC0A4|nr:superinfection immunity protein [Beijerinckia mobilis]
MNRDENTSAGFLIIAALLYFTPAIIALIQNHFNKLAIIIANTLLGWTVPGWVVCIIWSFTNSQRNRIVYIDGSIKRVDDTSRKTNMGFLIFLIVAFIGIPMMIAFIRGIIETLAE